MFMSTSFAPDAMCMVMSRSSPEKSPDSVASTSPSVVVAVATCSRCMIIGSAASAATRASAYGPPASAGGGSSVGGTSLGGATDGGASLAGAGVTTVDGSGTSLAAGEDAAPPHAVSVTARSTTARNEGRAVIPAIMHERRTARDAPNGP